MASKFRGAYLNIVPTGNAINEPENLNVYFIYNWFVRAVTLVNYQSQASEKVMWLSRETSCFARGVLVFQTIYGCRYKRNITIACDLMSLDSFELLVLCLSSLEAWPWVWSDKIQATHNFVHVQSSLRSMYMYIFFYISTAFLYGKLVVYTCILYIGFWSVSCFKWN